MAEQSAGPLVAHLTRAPLSSGGPLVRELLDDLRGAARGLDQSGVLDDPRVEALLEGVMSGSPYLTGFAMRDPERLIRIFTSDPDLLFADLRRSALAAADTADTIAALMAGLRHFKNGVALLTALADIGGAWPLEKVTGTLTDAADCALAAALKFLFRQAQQKGIWTDTSDDAAENSGLFVLGMGKYGARELNYSSDIDLIIFYDAEKAKIRDGQELQAFFVRMTRDLVKIMQERTGDGYVFRTDLRLRPDAGATQVALSTEAAYYYYESVGQNWERAAMIKARAVAGDIAAGNALLDELSPFIWRKYLDFAAIADVHAMKRQIHAHRGFDVIAVAGHNIKVGRGGIREIEFFAQTQQLIAGGRQSDLRVPQTLAALSRLTDRGWIQPKTRDELTDAYVYLRTIEHRLQMVADDQTHAMPSATDDLERFSRFAGYANSEDLSRALVSVLQTVQRQYAALFENVPELTRKGSNMVFAGEADDPGTLEALEQLGYSQPSQVIATVRSWHHGRFAAVRSAKARERLTEVQPILIEALAETADPDAALSGFDRFISNLPTGVQLFSLLRANPNLIRLVADIMGSAPRLARILSRRQRVIDAVLDPQVIGILPRADELQSLLDSELGAASDFQDLLDRARIVGNEQIFLIGVRVLSGIIGAEQAGEAYSLLAEQLIKAMQNGVEREFDMLHGKVPGGGAVVLAMGKLGGREMTAGSDLDLIVVYTSDSDAVQSNGRRPLSIGQYYARFTQRLISALSAPTAEGSIYEVDMRLRPSGQQGPVATQLSSFVNYQTSEAWTWEHMALTRARVLTGPPALGAEVASAIRAVLTAERDRSKLAADVRDMRQRIETEKGTKNIWNIKYARGGLVDLEFLTQFLQLAHASQHPDVLDQNTMNALKKLERHGLLEARHATLLLPAAQLLHNLTHILRLCLDDQFVPETAPHGLKSLLARVADAPDFAHLERVLAATLKDCAQAFDEIVR